MRAALDQPESSNVMADGRIMIFVIDDDEAVRDSLSLLLESYGMAVEAYASTEAFAEAYRPHERECLILDQHLQNAKTGLDFLKSETRARIALPAILMTGRGDAELRARALQAGAAAYLEKPVDDGLLVAAIAAAIAVRRP
jgi:FixJ family two-component response regulator